MKTSTYILIALLSFIAAIGVGNLPPLQAQSSGQRPSGTNVFNQNPGPGVFSNGNIAPGVSTNAHIAPGVTDKPNIAPGVSDKGQ